MKHWHNRDKENVIDRDEFPYIADEDYYCKKCGKSKYSEFTYIGTPVGMSGWSEDKVCPACGAKVEINHHENYFKPIRQPRRVLLFRLLA